MFRAYISPRVKQRVPKKGEYTNTMVHALMLLIHVLVACITLAACVYVAGAVLYGVQKWFTHLSLLIALCALLETGTGFLLAVLSTTASPMGVVSHMVFYLSICLLTEVTIVLEQRRVWIG